MPRLSVITSLYCSEPYIQELYDRTLKVIKRYTDDYEFVFVDDGSPDNGNDVVKQLIAQDKNVRLIELSRNFGQHKAIMVGLEHVRGDYVFMFDSDLEEEPELLGAFYDMIVDSNETIDVVYGIMEKRKGNIFERVSGTVFYKLINYFSDMHIPANVMAARLMKIGYVKNLIQFREFQLYLGGVMTLTGYNQVGYQTKKLSKGRTTYSLRLKLTLALDALLSYTNKPLTIIAFFGIMISIFSFVLVFYILADSMVRGTELQGWLLVLASVWFLGGLTVTAIGMVGFYVGRIFLQVKGRPNAIVKQIYN